MTDYRCAELKRLLREVWESGVAVTDEKTLYVTVQIDRRTWERLREIHSVKEPA